MSDEFEYLIAGPATTYHSVQAYLANQSQKVTIDNTVLQYLMFAYYSPHLHAGVTATQMSGWVGLKEHKSVAASLSRLRKRYNCVRYMRRPGYSHGLYYYYEGLEEEE